MSLILEPCTDGFIELDSTSCVRRDDSLEQRLGDLPLVVEPLSS